MEVNVVVVVSLYAVVIEMELITIFMNVVNDWVLVVTVMVSVARKETVKDVVRNSVEMALD